MTTTELPCPICTGTATAFDVVDFNKSCPEGWQLPATVRNLDLLLSLPVRSLIRKINPAFRDA